MNMLSDRYCGATPNWQTHSSLDKRETPHDSPERRQLLAHCREAHARIVAAKAELHAALQAVKDYDRRPAVARALQKKREYDSLLVYHRAEREHTWLLRAEGLTFPEIAARMGVKPHTALLRFRRFAREVDRALRHTHFWIERAT